MTIVVTGGFGFVGSHFVWAANRTGRRVVVFDDGSTANAPRLPADVEVIEVDIGDRRRIDGLFARLKPEAIAHFAGRTQIAESVKNPALYFDVNVTRALALLESARMASIGAFVFSSSASVYGEPETVPIVEGATKSPVNPYGASKLAFELALEAYERAHGLRWCALRYFNASGAEPSGLLREAHDPETHLIPIAVDAGLGRRPPLVIFGTDYPTDDGTCVRDYVHVNDLADAHLLALDRLRSGEVLGAMNLGTGAGHSVRDVLGAASSVLGTPVPFVVGARRDGDPSILVADATRAQSILGWTPKRSDLATIMEDTLRSRR